jgi:hypothetical protein
MDLITNGIVIDDALKFVDRNKNDDNKSHIPSSNKRENNDEFPIVTNDSTIVL